MEAAWWGKRTLLHRGTSSIYVQLVCTARSGPRSGPRTAQTVHCYTWSHLPRRFAPPYIHKETPPGSMTNHPRSSSQIHIYLTHERDSQSAPLIPLRTHGETYIAQNALLPRNSRHFAKHNTKVTYTIFTTYAISKHTKKSTERQI